MELMRGARPPPQFNHSLMLFIPKGDQPPSATECIRTPGALRPLTLKNSDAKLCAAAGNRYLRTLAEQCVDDVQ
eukprot:7444845-Pyramimonas_sp.AAC.1